jgi:hypothetical protein
MKPLQNERESSALRDFCYAQAGEHDLRLAGLDQVGIIVKMN